MTAPLSPMQSLFEELIELPPAERTRRLETLAPEQAQVLRALLEADTTGNTPLDQPVEAAIERWRDDDDGSMRELVGSMVGPFRVSGLIGFGGSAVVFRAERPAGLGSQTVALKLLRAGLFSADAQRRFLREQAIQAQLSHPDIARLIEGGVSEAGIPYIAMELVEGLPITLAAEQRRLGLEARLQLFLRLCRAVQAAHASLIVHCDLKPGNVLVEPSGQLKVLDFGIAKLLDQGSGPDRTQSLAMTPEYAAPEQFRPGPPAVTVDVFGLGVILGELLCGRRLGGRTPNALSNALAAGTLDEPPPGLPPRADLLRRVRGDLDAIVDTALAPDPARRYPSAEALARDLERFLEHRVVHANPRTRWGQLGKFVTRHRAAVLVPAVLFLALVASLGFALRAGADARYEAERAQAAVLHAEGLREVLFSAFAEAKPGGPRTEQATVVDAIERALAMVSARRDLDARARLEVQTQLAEVLSSQGAHARAGEALEEAFGQAQRLFDAGDPLRLRLEYLVAYNAAMRGESQTARELLDQYAGHLPESAEAERIDVLTTSAWLAGAMGERDRAMREGREAVTRARALGEPRRIVEALNAYGTVLLDFNEGAEAIAVYQDLVARHRAQYGNAHALLAAEETALARAYRLVADLPKAEQHARNAVEIEAQVYAGDHWHKGLTLNALMAIQSDQRKYEDALATNAEAIRVFRATQGEQHPNTVMAFEAHATINQHLGNWTETLRWCRAAVEGHLAGDAESRPFAARASAPCATALAMSGRRGEAYAEIDRALALLGPEADAGIKARLHERKARLALDGNDVALAGQELAALAASPTPGLAARIAALQGEWLAQQQRCDAALPQLDTADKENDAAARRDPVLASAVALLRLACAPDAATKAAWRERAQAQWQALRYPPPHVARLAAAQGLAAR